MHRIVINDKLYDEISAYCSLNNMKIGIFCQNVLEKAIVLEKFGDTPFMDYGKEQDTAGYPDEKELYIPASKLPETKCQAVSVEINVNGDGCAKKPEQPKSKKRKLA